MALGGAIPDEVIEKDRPAAIAVPLTRLRRLSSRRRDTGGRPMAPPRLRTRIGVEVDQFAYHFGAWTRDAARLVAELGFRAAYTTDGNAISWSSSPHALPRVPAEGQAPGEFARLLADLSGR